MPKMMPPVFDPEWSPVSEEIVYRAAQEYLPDDWYINGLKAAGEEAKVEWNEEQFKHSEKFLLLQIKALIARNVWETQQYYQVMASNDPGVQKAMEIIGNEREYKRILKGK